MIYIVLDREKLNRELENNKTVQVLISIRSQCLHFFCAVFTKDGDCYEL